MTNPRLDLNGLIVFSAVMSEQSITRAAKTLSMTQPAVSNALGRLRSRFKDELFYKNGRGIQPTEKALEIWNQIHPALQTIEQAVYPPSFDAATAKRKFRVAASDIMVQQFWAPLSKVFEKTAPEIDLLAFPYQISEAEKMLTNSEIDLCLGVFPTLSSHLRSTYLYRSEFVCAMRIDHPLAAAKMTMKAFLDAKHLLVSLSGEPWGHVDRLLAERGLKRRVAMTVNNFGGVVVELLMQTNLIAVIPMDLVRNEEVQAKLHLTRPPVVVPPVLISMAWHNRFDRDFGHAWLRREFLAVAESLDRRHSILSDK